MEFHAGQRWTYRTLPGFEHSRMIIGAIVSFSGGHNVVCCSVTHAARMRPDGSLEPVNICFLPLTEAAMAASVVALDGEGEPLPNFAEKLTEWSEDPRGMTTFTVPFEGMLDRMIATQMAEIAGRSAA